MKEHLNFSGTWLMANGSTVRVRHIPGLGWSGEDECGKKYYWDADGIGEQPEFTLVERVRDWVLNRQKEGV